MGMELEEHVAAREGTVAEDTAACTIQVMDAGHSRPPPTGVSGQARSEMPATGAPRRLPCASDDLSDAHTPYASQDAGLVDACNHAQAERPAHSSSDSDCSDSETDDDETSDALESKKTCEQGTRQINKPFLHLTWSSMKQQTPMLARQLSTASKDATDFKGSISSFLCKSLLLPSGSLSLPISPTAVYSPALPAMQDERRSPGGVGWGWGSLKTSLGLGGFAEWKHAQENKENIRTGKNAIRAMDSKKKPAILAKMIVPYRSERELQHLFESAEAHQDLVARVLSARARRFPETPRGEQGEPHCPLLREVL